MICRLGRRRCRTSWPGQRRLRGMFEASLAGSCVKLEFKLRRAAKGVELEMLTVRGSGPSRGRNSEGGGARHAGAALAAGSPHRGWARVDIWPRELTGRVETLLPVRTAVRSSAKP